MISIDDSLGKKGKATKHLDAVDIQHNHNESSCKKQAYANGYVYVEVRLQIGPIGFLFDARLYLREKTVRRLNRERSPEQRLRYRAKYLLAREMLVELTELLPKGHKVYELFASWYSSAKLIKFCRRQKWQVICAVKSNRRIDKVRVDQRNLTFRRKQYEQITREAVDEKHKSPKDYTRLVKGHLEDVSEPVHAIISKKRPRGYLPQVLRLRRLALVCRTSLEILPEALACGSR